MTKTNKFIGILLIVLLLAASRLIKHPYNFSPVVAMSIFAGCYLKKYYGLLIPLAAMFVSDYIIGFYDWQVMGSVYSSIAVAYGIGYLLSKKMTWYNVVFSALASSVFFFLISNFAVWFFFDWYPHTVSGLISCFTLALPFFRNSLIGDLFYSGVLFGLFESVLYYVRHKQLNDAKI